MFKENSYATKSAFLGPKKYKKWAKWLFLILKKNSHYAHGGVNGSNVRTMGPLCFLLKFVSHFAVPSQPKTKILILHILGGSS